MARGGFLNGPLEERIADYVSHIAPPLLELIGAMQANVLAVAESEARTVAT